MEFQRKRKASPGFVANPFIKKRNLEWRISPPPLSNPERRTAQEGREDREGLGGNETCSDEVGTSKRDTSPSAPPDRPISPPSTTTTSTVTTTKSHPSTSALIESAQLQIDNHLTYFTTLLTTHTLHPFPPSHPRLPIISYTSLYARAHGRPTGAHFVVTQHDHPVAGPHYDLRLQINATSSCSWAIMYGLPGDANSRGKKASAGGAGGRTGSGVLRNATETRVHCLWNHLVETAGRETGSLIVWDTGEYEVLAPRRRGRQRPLSSSSSSSSSGSESEASENGGEDGGGGEGSWAALTQQEKLARAFASRKIRLKLHGTRLPKTYVLNIRLTQAEDAAGRAKAAASSSSKKKPRRRRRAPAKPTLKAMGPDTSDSDSDDGEGKEAVEDVYNDKATGNSAAGLTEMEKELRELEDEEVRRTNAYVGAVNTIGSVHQRRWFLSLEREACGFVRGKRDGRVWWERKDDGEEAGEAGEADENRLKWPFYVRGPEYERSVVTGRLSRDVLKDEGVVGYVGRKGWRPILG